MKLRLPTTRRYRIYLYILSILIILFAIDLVWVRIDRRITLGRDTTYITSPLKPDGTPDYIQAINDAYSAGITDDNNAAPILLSAFDPDTILNPPYRAQVYARLRVPLHPQPLGYRDIYPVAIDAQGNRTYDEKADGELYACGRSLWKAADHPVLAQWLESAAPSFDALHLAAKRPRYYIPYEVPPGRHAVADMEYPSMGAYRQLAFAACARAMLRAATGDFEGARADLIAVHRLARLIGQGQFIMERLISAFVDQTATDAEDALATSTILTSSQARELLADIQSLQPLPNVTDALYTERYEVLDILAYASRHGISETVRAFSLTNFMNNDAYLGNGKLALFASDFVPTSINAAMRQTNAYYNRCVADARVSTYARMIAGKQATERDLDRLYDKSMIKSFFNPAEQLAAFVTPSPGMANQFYVIQHMPHDLARVALALAAYHADHHAYPPTLAELTRAYLPAIPEDLFINQPLHYTLTPTGYRLYSVGRNMKDDDGQTQRHHDDAHPHADDLTITVPPPQNP